MGNRSSLYPPEEINFSIGRIQFFKPELKHRGQEGYNGYHNNELKIFIEEQTCTDPKHFFKVLLIEEFDNFNEMITSDFEAE